MNSSLKLYKQGGSNNKVSQYSVYAKRRKIIYELFLLLLFWYGIKHFF